MFHFNNKDPNHQFHQCYQCQTDNLFSTHLCNFKETDQDLRNLILVGKINPLCLQGSWNKIGQDHHNNLEL